MTTGLDVRQGAPFRGRQNEPMAHPSSQTPAHIDRILVVAPTDALRASLRFLLEEESYQVSAAASIEEAGGLKQGFACTVVDHHVLKSRRPDEISAFLGARWPVVLLANGIPGAELPASFRVVTKPLLGAALSHAVREAVGLAASLG